MLSHIRCISILLLCLQCGCTSSDIDKQHPEPCSDEWNRLVDSRFPTGDGLGHGPDIGGQEWKSVVEFKLGIRGNADVPDLDSPQWCNYIDDYINRHGD